MRLVEVVAVDAVRLGQRAHRLGGQRGEPDPHDAGGRGQLAEHDPQRRAGVVAEGRHDERGHGADAAADQPQRVERALVGPVDVLEHEHGAGRGAQLAQQRRDQRGGPGARGDRLEQLAAGGVRDVEQRAERARSLERIAGAPQHACARLLGEGAHERGLADARLPADQHQPAGRAGQHVEKRLALQQHEAA